MIGIKSLLDVIHMVTEPKTETSYVSLFYGWDVRPGRDEAWYNKQKANADDESHFTHEYPSSADEALAPPKSLAAFNHEVLNLMRRDCMEPVEVMPLWGETVFANIYRDYEPGKKYAAGTDTAHGGGGDDAATTILETDTGCVVADILSNQIEPQQLAMASMDLLHRYGNPIWGIEDNDWGILTISTAQDMSYPHLFSRADGKVGWHTSDSARLDGSRFLLWGNLVAQTRIRGLTVYRAEGLSQFYTVIKNPKKHSRMEAQEGAKDDYPMAVGIALAIKHLARKSRDPNRRARMRTEGVDREEMELVDRPKRRYGW